MNLFTYALFIYYFASHFGCVQCVSLPRFVFHTVEDTLIGNGETSEIKQNINEEFTASSNLDVS